MSFKKPTQEELDMHQKRAHIASLFLKKVYHRKLYEESLTRKRKGRKEMNDIEKWCVIEIYNGSREILGTYDTYIDAKFACEDYAKMRAILVSWGLNPWNYGEFRVVKIKNWTR